MLYDVLITQNKRNKYIAQVLSFPQLVVEGDNEVDALEKVRLAIRQKQQEGRLVRLEVPDLLPDPWLPYGGMWENDPDWDEFEKSLAEARQRENERAAQ